MKPLLICDCDEVLLHFVTPFAAYLAAEHALTLNLDSFALTGNIRDADGVAIDGSRVMPLLGGFFDTHMPTQTPAPGAAKALAAIAAIADVVILTNITDGHAELRASELARLGMPYRVVGNSGGKGAPVRALIEHYRPTRSVFVDDLPPHHNSVKREAPEVHRVHMVAEPKLRGLIPDAPDADVRLDDWSQAGPYILRYMEG